MDVLILSIILFPLIGFVINGVFGNKLSEKAIGFIGSSAVFISFLLSCYMCFHVSGSTSTLQAHIFDWALIGSSAIPFGLMVDHLSVWMMLIVTGIGFLIHIYSIGYMHGDKGFYKFFAYLNLFIMSMLLLIMGNNYVLLFFGWEGVGLCSYLLIGFWYTNEAYGKAARKAFIMNRIGDLGLLLGIFFIFQQFGAIDFETLNSRAFGADSTTVTIICILLFVGAIGKSAQIPLFTWLPDAMAGPTPVSALIHAATMVTAGIYLVVRSNMLFSQSPTALTIILVVGLATSLLAGLIGLRQNDIKKVLAYSTVSQLGLMFAALGVGAYTTAMFHVTTHAFFKALLFLGSGSVIHALHGEQDITKMGGLKDAMPTTFKTFAIGTLAIIGFPFFAGFFSKDEILAKLYEASPVWWIIGIVCSVITAFYMLRMFFSTFYGTFRGTAEQKHHLHESPSVITLPLIVLSILSLLGGLLNLPSFLGNISQFAAHWFEKVEGLEHVGHHAELSTELILMGLTTSVVLFILYTSHKWYVAQKNVPQDVTKMEGWQKLFAHKFYIDEAYDFLFVRPLEGISNLYYKVIDNELIDGIVNGAGRAVQLAGSGLRYIQNGNIEYYLIYMVLAILAIIGFGLL